MCRLTTDKSLSIKSKKSSNNQVDDIGVGLTSDDHLIDV